MNKCTACGEDNLDYDACFNCKWANECINCCGCLEEDEDSMEEMIEYLKIHIVSLNQDLEKISYTNEHHFYLLKQAEIKNTEHLLSVAQDILDKEEEN